MLTHLNTNPAARSHTIFKKSAPIFTQFAAKMPAPKVITIPEPALSAKAAADTVIQYMNGDVPIETLKRGIEWYITQHNGIVLGADATDVWNKIFKHLKLDEKHKPKQRGWLVTINTLGQVHHSINTNTRTPEKTKIYPLP